MNLPDIATISKNTSSYRRSSWDRSGKNKDFLLLEPGQNVVLLNEQGPGRITHLYWTTINGPVHLYRQLILRAYWDEEMTPSIEAPIGDLFCVPHCRPVPVHSLCAAVNPGGSHLSSWGFNLYLPMPFADSARLELEYQPIPGREADTFNFWYHVELERFEQPLAADAGRLHAQWRRENLTRSDEKDSRNQTLWDGANLDGKGNYVALEAEGTGQMVGLHLQVDNVGGGWYGEGDDMIFVDGEPGDQWPPTYHGTGSEEIFGGGACPNYAYSNLYTGFHLVDNDDWKDRNAMYRWYLADPIRFQRSLVWSIEHGHANNYENDYASVAYWYQHEPHAVFPVLPVVSDRLPRVPAVVAEVDGLRARLRNRTDASIKEKTEESFRRAGQLQQISRYAGKAILAERWEEALAILRNI